MWEGGRYLGVDWEGLSLSCYIERSHGQARPHHRKALQGLRSGTADRDRGRCEHAHPHRAPAGAEAEPHHSADPQRDWGAAARGAAFRLPAGGHARVPVCRACGPGAGDDGARAGPCEGVDGALHAASGACGGGEVRAGFAVRDARAGGSGCRPWTDRAGGVGRAPARAGAPDARGRLRAGAEHRGRSICSRVGDARADSSECPRGDSCGSGGGGCSRACRSCAASHDSSGADGCRACRCAGGSSGSGRSAGTVHSPAHSSSCCAHRACGACDSRAGSCSGCCGSHCSGTCDAPTGSCSRCGRSGGSRRTCDAPAGSCSRCRGSRGTCDAPASSCHRCGRSDGSRGACDAPAGSCSCRGRSCCFGGTVHPSADSASGLTGHSGRTGHHRAGACPHRHRCCARRSGRGCDPSADSPSGRPNLRACCFTGAGSSRRAFDASLGACGRRTGRGSRDTCRTGRSGAAHSSHSACPGCPCGSCDSGPGARGCRSSARRLRRGVPGPPARGRGADARADEGDAGA